MGWAKLSNGIGFQECPEPPTLDGQAAKRVLTTELRAVAFQGLVFKCERRGRGHVILQSLSNAALRFRGSTNVNDLAASVVYNVHAPVGRSDKPFAFFRKLRDFRSHEFREKFSYGVSLLG